MRSVRVRRRITTVEIAGSCELLFYGFCLGLSFGHVVESVNSKHILNRHSKAVQITGNSQIFSLIELVSCFKFIEFKSIVFYTFGTLSERLKLLEECLPIVEWHKLTVHFAL